MGPSKGSSKGLFMGLLLLLNLGYRTQAATGDTTWVQAHQDIQMPYFGNFDTLVQFPDGTVDYQRVFMTLRLGKYVCPPQESYCGDWDYTVQTFLMTPQGDTVELGRLITPYANAGFPRTPWSWKKPYVFDVTDFASLLKDSAWVRIHYSGYSGGFTADLRFCFIEGLPHRPVLAMDRIWHGAFPYGGTTPIEDHLPERIFTPPPATVQTLMRWQITGHGADNMGCAEFCSKAYTLSLNQNFLVKKDIWRDDCGSNALYPQSGTWIYNRANWCPGALVEPIEHIIAPAPAGQSCTLGIQFDPHQSSASASYIMDGMLFHYGAPNFQLEASLEAIISPNSADEYFRKNPGIGRPVIRVQNRGSQKITQLKIRYGFHGEPSQDYTWHSSAGIDFFEERVLVLPALPQRPSGSSSAYFEAEISEVNGGKDALDYNNRLRSAWEATPEWPAQFSVMFSQSQSSSTAVETTYRILDANGVEQWSRLQPQLGKLYRDTLNLAPGYYQLVVEDLACNGLNWWAAPGQTGVLSVYPLGSVIPLPLKGYFSGDFGCGFTTSFQVAQHAKVQDGPVHQAEIRVYPNPATEQIDLEVRTPAGSQGRWMIRNIMGQVVANIDPKGASKIRWSVSDLPAGVYLVLYVDPVAGIQSLPQRFTIRR